MPAGRCVATPGARTSMPVTGLAYWIESFHCPGGRVIFWLAVSPGREVVVRVVALEHHAAAAGGPPVEPLGDHRPGPDDRLAAAREDSPELRVLAAEDTARSRLLREDRHVRGRSGALPKSVGGVRCGQGPARGRLALVDGAGGHRVGELIEDVERHRVEVDRQPLGLRAGRGDPVLGVEGGAVDRGGAKGVVA